jgi:selenide,water dikinase
VALPAGFPEWKRKLITDPQTSGGLLVSCAPGAVQPVLDEFRKRGFGEAAVIGSTAALNGVRPYLAVT